jgi:hypothetical protein
MRHRLCTAAFTSLVAALGLGTVARAQEAAAPPPDLAAQAAPEWRFELAPYLWAVSLDGDATVSNNTVDIDAPFLDTVDESDSLIGLMGHFEAGKGKAAFFFDGAYTKVGVDDVVAGTDLETQMAWGELGMAWRLAEGPIGSFSHKRWSVDALGGARFTALELKLDFAATGSASGDRWWAEPFFGARGTINIAEDWVLRLRGDVGGMVGESNFSWQTAALVGWEFGADSALFFGYRVLSQDYDSGTFKWDVIAHGPVLGLSFEF